MATRKIRYAVRYARWSSGEQGDGDTLRRQDREFLAFCTRHHLEPLPGFELPPDQGVSAYKSGNLKKGSLADFLMLAKTGRIPAGTVLVVENQDRLSRDKISVVMRLFQDLIAAGICLGDCLTNRIVDEAGLDDPMTLMTIIMGAVRANEYAQSLGRRTKSNWQGKRERAAAEKMTKMCPHWLRLSDDRKRYELIPERVKTIRLIFELACKGKGCKGITDELEKRGIKTAKGLPRWHPTFVVRMLKDRAVLGEFQPKERVTRNKAVAMGSPIPDYFPAIIKPETFDKANALVTSRTLRRVGRQPHRTNIFAGLLFDGHGDPYHVMITYPRKYRLLESKYGAGGSRISYEKTLEAFLLAVKEIDPSEFQPEADDATTELIEALAAIDAKIAGLKLRIKKETEIDYLVDLVRDLTRDRETVKARLDQVEMTRRNPVSEAVTGLQQATLDDPEYYRARLRLAVEVIHLIVTDHAWFGRKWKSGFVSVRFRRGITRIFGFSYRNSRGYLQEPVRYAGWSCVFPTEDLRSPVKLAELREEVGDSFLAYLMKQPYPPRLLRASRSL